MESETDILIVGGGLNGSALALALAQVGLHVTLVDSLPADTRADTAFDGRGYAIALAPRRMLAAMGIWDRVAEHSQPILDIMVSDGKAGLGASALHLHFDHREIEEGPMGHMLEDRYLRRALLQALAEHDHIRHLAPATVVAHETDPGRVTATLATGDTLTARLIIGCDGRRSPTAKRAGIGRTRKDYRQSSLVCAIDHDRPHNGVAHQFFMPDGPLAILPLPGNQSSIVWTQSTARAADIHGMEDADYLTCLRPCFGDFLGRISLAGKRFSYPLDLTLAQSFVAPRLALVGDAAHGLHPLAGQGLNLGLRDVAALAQVLAEASRRGEDIGATDVLERYQRWRRFDTASLAVATDGVNLLFSNDNPLVRFARNVGLAALNATPPLRRQMMRQAAGLSGDLPRLMQGHPI
jgi:2-octaprenyl-6-methoxyphenol hydroxylase